MSPVPLVVALGNTLNRDDGVGPRVLEILRSGRGTDKPWDDLDAGGSPFRILSALEGRPKALFIDCARMGEAPGTLRRFTPDQARSLKHLPRMSLHEGDLMELLSAAENLGFLPAETVIFGIEPGDLGWGEGLSEEVDKRLPEYVEAVLRDLVP